MYIEPNTDIYILKNVPLDTTYDHTIWFANIADQTAYFINLRKYALADYSYQRVRRGYMRVGINANNLYDCNYLMFRNTNFGSKWFYAYIKSVEYVNNDVSEVNFEIDDMQTWFFDYSLDECFVEREHSATDVIGDNIVPERVDLGEYVRNTLGSGQGALDSESQAYGSGFRYGYAKMFPYSFNLDPSKDRRMVMAQVIEVDSQTSASDGQLVDGIYSGCKYYWFKAETQGDIDDINQFLGSYINDPDAIVNMYMFSSALMFGEPPATDADYNGTSTTETLRGLKYATNITTASGRNFPFPVTFLPIEHGVTLDGYSPRNNKLYTYPYNFFEIDDGKGTNNILRYEFFEDGSTGARNFTPQFVIYTCCPAPAKAIIMPINYKGIQGDSPSYDEQLELGDFPACSWNADYYKMYMTQNFKADLMRTTGNLAGGLAGGMLAVGVKNAFESISNSMGNYYTASQKADIGKGNFSTGNALFSNREFGIRGGRMCVNRNVAQVIDQFFDRFGYATNLLKVPNTHARARWCYTKTAGCTISGSIPADSARHICEIYNNGITFWRNGQTVCDYSNPATNIPNGEVGD